MTAFMVIVALLIAAYVAVGILYLYSSKKPIGNFLGTNAIIFVVVFVIIGIIRFL